MSKSSPYRTWHAVNRSFFSQGIHESGSYDGKSHLTVEAYDANDRLVKYCHIDADNPILGEIFDPDDKSYKKRCVVSFPSLPWDKLVKAASMHDSGQIRPAIEELEEIKMHDIEVQINIDD